MVFMDDDEYIRSAIIDWRWAGRGLRLKWFPWQTVRWHGISPTVEPLTAEQSGVGVETIEIMLAGQVSSQPLWSTCMATLSTHTLPRGMTESWVYVNMRGQTVEFVSATDDINTGPTMQPNCLLCSAVGGNEGKIIAQFCYTMHF